jgi:hypothetical protein
MYPETHAHLLHKLDLAIVVLFPVAVLGLFLAPFIFKGSAIIPLVSTVGMMAFVTFFIVTIFKACIESLVNWGIVPLRCHRPGCEGRVKMYLNPAEGFCRVTRRYRCWECGYVYEFTGFVLGWGTPDL